MDPLDAASEPARRRYYIVSQDIESKPSYDLLNEDDILIGGIALGKHRVQLRDLNFYFHVGLPALSGTPMLKVGSRSWRAAPLDFYGDERFFASTRLKDLLLQFDESAFEVAECKAVDAKGEEIESYWWMEAVRILDAVDESRSDLIRQTENPFSDRDAVDEVRYYRINDAVMKPDVIKECHVFRLAPYSQRMIVSGEVVDECRKQGITGIVFTPLQRPSALDCEKHLSFQNYPYWTNLGYGK
jgi:hypothetical protein